MIIVVMEMLISFSGAIFFILTLWGCLNGLMYLFNIADAAENIDDAVSAVAGVAFFMSFIILRVLYWFTEKILRNFFKNEILMWSFVSVECLMLFFLCLVTKSLLVKLIIFIIITILAGFILSDFGQDKIRQIIKFLREERVK